MKTSKKKIVILGGGLGALTTAYYLTDRSGWQHEYDITVYQQGWRLGGKGASSRNPDKNYRIEEHGLHCWFGFYQNAFAMMRRVYGEWKRPEEGPVAEFADAFTPRSKISILEEYEGVWERWPIPFPHKGHGPGLEPPNTKAWQLLVKALVFLERFLGDWLQSIELSGHPQPQVPSGVEKVASVPQRGALLRQSIALLENQGLARDKMMGDKLIRGWLEGFRRWVGRRLNFGRTSVARERRLWIVADLILTVAIGVLEDDLLSQGLGSANKNELREWLSGHGASDLAVDSAPVRALYAATFCYDKGDVEKPNMAAGVAIGLYLRIGLLYQGDVLYEMNGGMGDVIVTPLYELLRDRGVRFEFFSRVEKLELDAGKRRVARVLIGRQVKLPQGEDSYKPLAHSRQLEIDYWPMHPLYDQIENGQKLKDSGENLESWWCQWPDADRKVLELGERDQVVLGISLGALGGITSELAEASQDWRKMLEDLPAIQTQAVQLWMKKNTKNLGWEGANPATMVAAAGAMAVWADMSHLIGAECWPPENSPASIQYFCGPLKGNLVETRPQSEASVPKDALNDVKRLVRDWFDHYTGWFWKKATQGGGSLALDRSLLFSSRLESGTEGLDAQYLRANIDPSERCIGSPAGRNESRLPSSDSGFENLYLAGDWTRTAINAGCVESTVMSAMAASRAICGHPQEISGEDFLQA